MVPLHGLGGFAAGAADLLVGSVWKSVVLVLLVAVLLRCMPRLSAAVRSCIWTAVLVLILLLPMLSLRVTGPASGGSGVLHAGAAWSFVVAGAWAVLSLLRLAQLLASALRLRAITRRALPVHVSEEISAVLSRGSRQVRLCVSVDVGRPSVAGFLRPCILLPAGLMEDLSAPELQHVVLHELEHLRRRDDWANLLQKLGLALFPLHPALLWLDRRLCLERELACDDGVLRVTGAPKGYAACLARLAEGSVVRRGLSLALGLFGGRSRHPELSRRVQRILVRPAVAMTRNQASLATAALLGVVAVGSMLLAHSPQLVSFAAGSSPSMGLSAALPDEGAGVVPQRAISTPSFRATNVKAVMLPTSQPTPQITRVLAHVNRKRVAPFRRVAVAQAPRIVGSPAHYLVLTAWHEQAVIPRLTLAVAEDSQQTYAAVPMRGGWLLIQL